MFISTTTKKGLHNVTFSISFLEEDHVWDISCNILCRKYIVSNEKPRMSRMLYIMCYTSF